MKDPISRLLEELQLLVEGLRPEDADLFRGPGNDELRARLLIDLRKTLRRVVNWSKGLSRTYPGQGELAAEVSERPVLGGLMELADMLDDTVYLMTHEDGPSYDPSSARLLGRQLERLLKLRGQLADAGLKLQ